MVRKPNEAELLVQKFIIGIQMTLPGAPMIYYGDEAGMWGGDDPDCRKPMVWQELDYENEMSHPFNKSRPSDEVSYNQELYEWYKKLIHIRNENEVLALGDLNFFLIDDGNNILGYERTIGDNKIFIILNNQDKPIEYKLSLDKLFPDGDTLEELVADKEYQNDNGIIDLALEPYQVMILKGF
ncbi:MAG: alpha-glucosidase C-terminal domain-containing protein [Ignavibacteriaceae bacterium]|nr:alpha-glucosidase C-terminal domain-containing protein [Ignavibacteriaceae bacterium]